MGFYYILLLFIGVFVTIGAGIRAFKVGTLLKKGIIFLGIIGISLISLSIFLLTPGSSEIISELLKFR